MGKHRERERECASAVGVIERCKRGRGVASHGGCQASVSGPSSGPAGTVRGIVSMDRWRAAATPIPGTRAGSTSAGHGNEGSIGSRCSQG